MAENKVVDVILHCQKQLKKEKLPEEKLLHYLGRLSRLRITVPDLAETGIGRTVNSLSRNEGSVGQAAETLVRGWKQMVSEQQSQAEARRQSEEESDSNSGSSEDDEEELNNDASEPPYDVGEPVGNPVEPYQNGHVNEVGPPSNRNEEFADDDEDVDDIEDPYMSNGFLDMTNVHTDEEDEDEEESEQESDSDASDSLRIADDVQQYSIQRDTEDLKTNTYIKHEKHRESDDFNKANRYIKQEQQREPEDLKLNAYSKHEKQRQPDSPKVNSNSYIKQEKSFEPEDDLNLSPYSKQEKQLEMEYLKEKTVIVKQEIQLQTEDLKGNTYIKQEVEAHHLSSPSSSEKGREHKSSHTKAKGSHHRSSSNSKSHHHNEKTRGRSHSPGSKEPTKEHKHHKQSKEHHRSSKHGDYNSESKTRHHHSSKSQHEKERSSSKDKQRSKDTKDSSSHRDSKSDKERERSREKKDSTNQNRSSSSSSTHRHSKDKDRAREMSSLKSSSPDRKKSELPEERKRKDPLDDGSVTLSKRPKLVIKEEIDSTSGVNFSDVLGSLDVPSSKLKKIKKEVDDKPYDKHESRKKKYESSSSSAGSYKSSREQEGGSSSRKGDKDSERSKLSKKSVHGKIEAIEKPAIHISPNYKPVTVNQPLPLPSVPRPSTSNGGSATLPLSHAEISDLGHVDYWENNEKDFTGGMSQEDAISTMLSNRNARSKVFSGVKTSRRGAVPSLFDLSMQVIKDNIGELGYTGGIPYDILKPALERANPQQLMTIESQNDHMIGETDELWQFHCRRDFRGQCPEETESWRELYERCSEGRDLKLEQIRKKMKLDMMKRERAEPVRKTKLAYVDSTSGPRFHKEKAQTIKNGMKTLKILEEKGVKRHGASSSASVGFNNPKISGDPSKVILQEASVIIAPDSRSGHAPAPSVSRGESVAKQKPKRAPLMQKTMKLIRSLNRR